MTNNLKEKVERKAFIAKSEQQYHVSRSGQHDCNAHNKKNGDYNEYPSFSYLMNKL